MMKGWDMIGSSAETSAEASAETSAETSAKGGGTLPASSHCAEQVVEVVVVRVGARTAHAHPQIHVGHPVGWEEGRLGTGPTRKNEASGCWRWVGLGTCKRRKMAAMNAELFSQ